MPSPCRRLNFSGRVLQLEGAEGDALAGDVQRAAKGDVRRRAQNIHFRRTRILRSVATTKHPAQRFTSSATNISSMRAISFNLLGKRNRISKTPWCVPGAKRRTSEKSRSCVTRRRPSLGAASQISRSGLPCRPSVSVRRLHLDEGFEFLRGLRVCGRRVDFIGEDLVVVGFGDGQIEPGQ
jgi:hypothetical protein